MHALCKKKEVQICTDWTWIRNSFIWPHFLPVPINKILTHYSRWCLHTKYQYLLVYEYYIVNHHHHHAVQVVMHTHVHISKCDGWHDSKNNTSASCKWWPPYSESEVFALSDYKKNTTCASRRGSRPFWALVGAGCSNQLQVAQGQGIVREWALVQAAIPCCILLLLAPKTSRPSATCTGGAFLVINY